MQAPERQEIDNNLHGCMTERESAYNQCMNDWYKWIDEAPIEEELKYIKSFGLEACAKAIRKLLKGN